MSRSPNRDPQIPEPITIARRIAKHTGSTMIGLDRGRRRRSHLRHEFSYGVDEQIFSVAALRSSLFVAADGPNTRPSNTRDYQIGTYDSGQQRWRFYPEYVEPDEGQSLQRVFEDLVLDRYANFEPKGIFADGRHPLTIRARGETGALLVGTGIAERLIADRKLGHLPARMDEASTAYMTMSPVLDEEQHPGIGRFLDICFEDILNDQGRRVSSIDVVIASRTAATGNVWTPNEALTVEEWELLRPGPQILLECEAADRDFYAGGACVVYRYGTPSGGLGGHV